MHIYIYDVHQNHPISAVYRGMGVPGGILSMMEESYIYNIFVPVQVEGCGRYDIIKSMIIDTVPFYLDLEVPG